MAAKLLFTGELPIRDIDVSDRLRPLSETAVVSLMASIEEVGQQSEIHVRKIRHQGGRMKLILGRHRIEALSRLGCTSIASKLWDCTDDWARMAEIDDNLAHADLNALDLAVFLAERKVVYERMYPEAKAATGAALVAKRWNTTDMMSAVSKENDVMSFCQSVAEQRDLSERQIRRLVAAGQALDRESIRQLRAAPKRVTLADLQTLAKCGVEADRRAICAALAAGEAKSAKAALTARYAKPGDVARQPADLDARRLADAFARASQEGRKRFARDHLEALQKLIAQVSK
ncbi:ParB/RepB/Spo0J family partition protein [Sulfitobacter sp. G21635-S1]|uniref:ParB/RepB/Spo0J family partition protein n=1 Tax=Sulfitobacter sp. G21635-S1 TaxID=3014043 RepID=UPI0022B0244C|nr:ParB/RepB/Spo0J family partition protein [Sulfitobacter sp. G21635-S1]MCZ4258645.1 ParB/RepB/Spo0J family partition protein [Sulfitobacter sp. G21635-S1]